MIKGDRDAETWYETSWRCSPTEGVPTVGGKSLKYLYKTKENERGPNLVILIDHFGVWKRNLYNVFHKSKFIWGFVLVQPTIFFVFYYFLWLRLLVVIRFSWVEHFGSFSKLTTRRWFVLYIILSLSLWKEELLFSILSKSRSCFTIL